MNFAVLQFPASNCDQDAVHVLKNVLGHSARYAWHKDTSLGNADAVVVPGGFSYGDYFRTGAIARFSPIMQAVRSSSAPVEAIDSLIRMQPPGLWAISCASTRRRSSSRTLRKSKPSR